MSDLVGNPEDKISHAEAHFTQPLSPLYQSLGCLCVSDIDLAVLEKILSNTTLIDVLKTADLYVITLSWLSL